MIVEKIHISKFKAISEATLALDDVNILIGPNNSGKSSCLQAIHLSSILFRQAKDANKDSTISLSDMEYIPSEKYRDLYHNGRWGNANNAPESNVSYEFSKVNQNGELQALTAKMAVKTARNEGISVKPRMSPDLIPELRGRQNVFTAYIPGISGIPVKEEKISRLHVYRKAASGDSNVVLRNILNIINEDGKLDDLSSLIKRVYPNAKLTVQFDEDRDYFINVEISFGSTFKSIEFSGTGFLQVLQILSYIVLFKPRILLIDEPESHLHPTLQTRLVRLLQEEAAKSGARIIITTHSPFVINGLGYSANLIWLKDGGVVTSSDSQEIRDALGWGAIDKKVLLLTEDSRVSMLRSVVRQEPRLEDRVAIVPFEGVTKLGSATAVANLREALGNQHEIVIHRDRDCMLENELESWVEEYQNRNIGVWITDGSDIEAGFCSAAMISHNLEISIEDAEGLLDAAIKNNEEKFRKEFDGKRREINKFYEKTGGSPGFDDLWKTMQPLDRIKGKSLLSSLRKVVQDSGGDEKALTKIRGGYVGFVTLMSMLQKSAY